VPPPAGARGARARRAPRAAGRRRHTGGATSLPLPVPKWRGTQV